VAQKHEPMTPQNIFLTDDSRWEHNGVDVTDMLMSWRCALGHIWQASLHYRTRSDDKGCPECATACFAPTTGT
jgi:hypothetical protein